MDLTSSFANKQTSLPKTILQILKGFGVVVISDRVAFDAFQCPARKGRPQVGKLLHIAQFLV